MSNEVEKGIPAENYSVEDNVSDVGEAATAAEPQPESKPFIPEAVKNTDLKLEMEDQSSIFDKVEEFDFSFANKTLNVLLNLENEIDYLYYLNISQGVASTVILSIKKLRFKLALSVTHVGEIVVKQYSKPQALSANILFHIVDIVPLQQITLGN